MDSVTVFDEPKMIVIDQSTFLSAKDTTKYDIEAFIRRSNEDQQVIVIYCCPAQKLDGRKKPVKKMQEVSKVIPWMALDEKSQPALIQELLKKYQLEPSRLRFVYPKRDKEANHILIEARKGVNKTPNLKILPPLIIYDENNQWTNDILKIYNYSKEE
jgi:hypothetical protein